VGGQGGMGDVVVHPEFVNNNLIYLSLIESNDGGATRGAVVIRGKLTLSPKPVLKQVERIWTQTPKRRGRAHFSHRLAFGTKSSGQKGKLFITSGDRKEQTPAQKWNMALGKIIRINDDGSIPKDNPFQNEGELAKSFWSLGHRNLLGIAFDANGNLWASEMGPKHGDELNFIKPGQNYGWPVVSNGNNYDGTIIPNHETRPEFSAPSTYWVPSIAPSSLVIYSGSYFAVWNGNAFIGGLIGRALIRVELSGEKASEAERFEWKQRIREVEQGPDGELWVLEDGSRARLLRLTKP
jgi:glucose/arabinose dehydrogenase